MRTAAGGRRIPIFAFFGASTISYIGDYLTLIAVPWFVLQTTGSVTKTGITAFFTTLPTVLSAFFGSTLVDRLGYKRTSIIGDIASGVSVALIPLLYSTIGLAFWQLLVLVFLGGLLKAPGASGRAALFPELVEMAGMPMERASAADDGSGRISGMIGALLAGVLIGPLGTSNLLWLDAASFAISAILIAAWVPVSAAKPMKAKSEGYIAELLEGISFICRTPIILILVLTVTITNLLDEALLAVILPDYAKQILGSAAALGTIVAAFGGASFVGTIIFGAIGHRLPRRLTFGMGFTLGGALRFWILALVPPLFVILISHVIAGVAAGCLNPILNTVEYERTPVEMRARVFGTITSLAFAAIPLGGLARHFLLRIKIISSESLYVT